MKSGLNASVDARIIVKLEDFAISRRAKFSPIVQEVLELGIEEYERREEERKFRTDLQAVKDAEALKKTTLEVGKR